MVTGSHNPPEYNGFKLSAGKETIYGEQILKLRETIKEQRTGGQAQGLQSCFDVKTAYTEYMQHEFSYLKDSWYRRLRIVVDGGNGTAGMIVPDILSALGCDIVPLYCESDGRFPHHHPDPTVIANMQDVIRETVKSGADFGVAYDGDADRIGVVDREGSIIWGDQLVMVLGRQVLAEHPGAKVIGDVKCSQVMFEDIQRHGGTPVMWKTGHSLVKQKMREEGALLAGEFSGHIFIADRYFGYDDAIYTTLRLVEIMKRTGKDIRELLADVPKTFSTPEIRMECPEDKKRKIVDEVIRRVLHYKESDDGRYPIKDVNTIDGIRVAFEKGWALVRLSNTQPVIVMRFEADSEERLRGYQEFVKTIVEDVEESL